MLKHWIIAAVTGLALSACSEKEEQPAPAPVETPAPEPVNLPQGFYIAASGTAKLIDPANGYEHAVATLDKNTCLKVIDGVTNEDHAHVETRLDAPPEQRVRGYVLKSALTPAPQCRERLQGPFVGNPENPTGFRLLSNSILYATREGGNPVGHLLKDDCVKIEETRGREQFTKLSATVGGRALSGWAFDAKIDLNTRCPLGL